MQTPDEVAAMLRLKALGWGVRRIAGELGCSHMTVRRYLAAGGWVAYRGRGRPRTLSGLEEWVAERFRRHAGNADVVRQELEREKGIRLTLRTVEREVRHLRRELEAEARATIRFETPPGKQLQIDFGERRAMHRFKSRRYWRRAGCQASSEPWPVPIWDDRRASGHSFLTAQKTGGRAHRFFACHFLAYAQGGQSDRTPKGRKRSLCNVASTSTSAAWRICSAERRPGTCSSRCRRRTWSSVGRSLKIQRASVAAPGSRSVAAIG